MSPLTFLAALHGFTRDEMFEARRVLEVGVAGLAAARATGDQLASISEEITGMYASMDDPQAFLVHDIRFHRAVATAAANPILASLVEMISRSSTSTVGRPPLRAPISRKRPTCIGPSITRCAATMSSVRVGRWTRTCHWRATARPTEAGFGGDDRHRAAPAPVAAAG